MTNTTDKNSNETRSGAEAQSKTEQAPMNTNQLPWSEDDKQAIHDAYCHDCSRYAPLVGIFSPLSITGAVFRKHLDGPSEDENLAAILKALRRALRWNPDYWFYRFRPDSGKHPLPVSFRKSPEASAELVQLAYKFTLPEDDWPLLPETNVMLPSQD